MKNDRRLNPIALHNTGIHANRLTCEPQELAFVLAWDRLNADNTQLGTSYDEAVDAVGEYALQVTDDNAASVRSAIDALITATRADERAKTEREIVAGLEREFQMAMGPEGDGLQMAIGTIESGNYRKGDGDE